MSLDKVTVVKIAWNGALAALALVAVSLLVRYQVVQSPLYESSRTYVEAMEQAFRSVERGETEPEDYTESRGLFTGFRLAGGEVIGLMGEKGGRCYVVWERPDVGAGAGVLGGGLPCVPNLRLEFSQSYAGQVVVVPADGPTETVIEWDRLLPQSTTPGWFVLVISLLVWLAFNSLVSITITMYRRRRKT